MSRWLSFCVVPHSLVFVPAPVLVFSSSASTAFLRHEARTSHEALVAPHMCIHARSRGLKMAWRWWAMIAVITLAGLHSAKAFLDVGRPYSAIRCQPSAWYIHQNIETEACRLRHGRILHHRARRLRSARNHARCRRPDFVTLSLASRDPELSTLASPVSDSEDPPVRPEELPACTVYLYDNAFIPIACDLVTFTSR